VQRRATRRELGVEARADVVLTNRRGVQLAGGAARIGAAAGLRVLGPKTTQDRNQQPDQEARKEAPTRHFGHGGREHESRDLSSSRRAQRKPRSSMVCRPTTVLAEARSPCHQWVRKGAAMPEGSFGVHTGGRFSDGVSGRCGAGGQRHDAVLHAAGPGCQLGGVVARGPVEGPVGRHPHCCCALLRCRRRVASRIDASKSWRLMLRSSSLSPACGTPSSTGRRSSPTCATGGAR
jgi:hypothetical protein